jgi:hypothetical protein
MTRFDGDHFREFSPTPEEIERYLANARRDLDIAEKDGFIEVRFTYAYQSFIKAGIALIAAIGSAKVRPVPGHHVKIIEKMSEVLDDDEILAIGNQMRMKRNTDMYSGGTMISETDADAFVKFASTVLERTIAVIAAHSRKADSSGENPGI